MPGISSFGYPGRYYAGGKASQPKNDGLFEPRTNEDLQRPILQRHKVLQETVQRTVKGCNNQLRKLIRNETGLRFSGSEGQVIGIQVVDGLPLPLALAFEDISSPLLWELVLNNAILKATVTGLSVARNNFDALADRRLENSSDIDLREIVRTQAFISQLVDWVESAKLKKRFSGIDEDVLGAYFFKKRTIQIYWMAISLIARVLDVTIEGLSVAVLAHELVHAYTHLGNDHDGEQWETKAFADADNRIVEGLAQFYTATLCSKIEGRVPGVTRAFEQLLIIQSPAYTCFRDWTDGQERAGEIVRFSMIGCRKRRLTVYKEFLEEIGKVRERVGHQPAQ